MTHGQVCTRTTDRRPERVGPVSRCFHWQRQEIEVNICWVLAANSQLYFHVFARPETRPDQTRPDQTRKTKLITRRALSPRNVKRSQNWFSCGNQTDSCVAPDTRHTPVWTPDTRQTPVWTPDRLHCRHQTDSCVDT